MKQLFLSFFRHSDPGIRDRETQLGALLCFGNLANRCLTFVAKNFEGKVPPLAKPDAEDLELIEKLADKGGPAVARELRARSRAAGKKIRVTSMRNGRCAPP